MDYDPPQPGGAQVDYRAQPPPVKNKTYTKEELVHMLGTPALQEWIRALAGFNVLGSPVICVACLRMSNSLFGLREWMLFARFLRYSKLVKWPKRLPVLHGMLPCQFGEFLRKRAVSPLLLAQVTHTGSWKLPVGAVFNKMWEEESLSRHFPTYQEFDLVATTIRTVYNETARSDYANGQIHTPAPWG